MKKNIFKRIICMLAAVVMTIGCGVAVYAYDADYGHVEISIENAPEGTVFVDFLVRYTDSKKDFTKRHDYKVQLTRHYYNGTDTKEEEKDCIISSDSEIAQFKEGGYYSLMSNTELVQDIGKHEYYSNDKLSKIKYTMYLSGSYSHNYKSGNKDADLIYLEKRFDNIIAVYLDEKGNILGSTKEYESKYGSNYGISINGDKMTLTLDDHWRNLYWHIFTHLVLPVIAIIVVIFIFIKWIVQGIKVSED